MLGTDSVNDTMQAPTDSLSSTRTQAEASEQQHNHIDREAWQAGYTSLRCQYPCVIEVIEVHTN